jgi:hypothetical protein
MSFLINEKLFWDTNTETLDPVRHKQTIIERVLERGSWLEIQELISFYGKSEITEAAKKSRWFSDKTMHFISGYFDLPLEQMRCYKEKQLNPTHYL